MKYTESPKMTTLMKTKFILLTITFTLCSVAQAVEFGTYQPLYQTPPSHITSVAGYGSNYTPTGYGSSDTYSGYRSTSAISAPGAMYAPSLSSPFSTGRLGNSVYRSADDNLARSLQPNPPYGSRNKARRINHDGGDGNDFGEVSDDGWIWDGEEWTLVKGAKKIGPDGYTYEWDGSAWVPLSHQDDPNLPVGSIPWLLMVLLVGAYAYRHKKEVI